jgi:hypothetical protein
MKNLHILQAGPAHLFAGQSSALVDLFSVFAIGTDAGDGDKISKVAHQ